MRNQLKLLAAIATIGLWPLQHLAANPVGVDIGTGLPPTTLGGYTMAAFDPGSIPGAQQSTMISGSGGGSEDFWATWGQSYTGHVYVVDDTSSPSFSDTITITLGAGTQAIDFYEEPNQFLNFDMTATDSSGVSVTTVINGFHGSSGVGFYETDPSAFLSTITVTATDPTGFAIGEFGVNTGGSFTGTVGAVPDSGNTLILIGVGLLGLVAYRRFGRGVTVRC
jgi:hypothetical protein